MQERVLALPIYRVAYRVWRCSGGSQGRCQAVMGEQTLGVEQRWGT